MSVPKLSLLNFFLNKQIPKLEKLIEDFIAQHGLRTVVRYQMDNAGPRCEKKLQDLLQQEFDDRGWMIVTQPPNSPIYNVKDACIFPALSKSVSSLQATIYDNKLLECEEINNCVIRAWQTLPKNNNIAIVPTSPSNCCRHGSR